MTPFIDRSVDNGGVCGSSTQYRCDDGQCCSQYGYCGPEYDGSGYIDYDTDSSGNTYYKNNISNFTTRQLFLIFIKLWYVYFFVFK